jgi:hypothetical protein
MEHSQTGVRNRGNLRSVVRFLVVLGGLNLVWEIGQLPFYSLWHDGSWQEIGYAIAHCTAGDVLIALACAIAALAFIGWHWPRPGRKSAIFMLSFIAFGEAYTVFSKWLNTTVRLRWSYSDLMPVLPPLGTGVAPLLQWIAVPTLAFWLSCPTGEIIEATE